MLTRFFACLPDPQLYIKPDISTPGGNIYSSIPVKMGKYAQLSGT